MKRFKAIGAALAAAAAWLGTPATEAQAPPAGEPASQTASAPASSNRPPAALPAPIGALWVPASGAPFRDKLHFDRFIDDLRGMPFTEFIIQVRDGGSAFYVSDMIPLAPGIPEDFDPLAAIIEGLHKAPDSKKVIAWIDPYHAGNLKDASPLGKNHVLLQHQEWLSLLENRDSADADGNMYLEPGLAAVQTHLEAAITELVSKYKIDGLYIDPMGDPAGPGQWGYHPEVVRKWVEETGVSGAPPSSDPKWQAFRAKIITDALQGFIAAAHKVRPDLPIGVNLTAQGATADSAKNFYKSPVFQQTHQDYPKWLELEGLSRIYVRDFRPEQGEQAAFDGWLNFALTMAQGHSKSVVIGVSGAENQALDALAQLRRAAEAGADGLALWNYQQPVRDRGSESLFMGAIGRTVLSPEYLRSLAAIKRSRTEPLRLSLVTKASNAASSPSQVAIVPQPPIPSEGTAVSPATAAPAKIDPVPDENPGSIPAANGALISASTGQTVATVRPTPAPAQPPAPAGGGVDRETMKALDILLGKADAAPTTTTTTTDPIITRQQLINDLLSDPSFRSTNDFRSLWNSEDAARELRKKFKNIF